MVACGQGRTARIGFGLVSGTIELRPHAGVGLNGYKESGRRDTMLCELLFGLVVIGHANIA